MSKYAKIRKIVLFTLAALLVVILLTAAMCVIYTNSGDQGDRTPSAFFSSWMSHIDDNTLIKDIVIPGSHDAGTYTMSWLGKTQHTDIETQLKCGTRYFDLRVEKSGNDYFIFHGPFTGGKFKPQLQAVKSFLDANPSETIILDFQHFKGDSFSGVIEMLESVVKTTYMVRNTNSTTLNQDFINTLKLKDARKKCVVFWGSDSNSTDKNYIFKRADDGGGRANPTLYSFYDSALNTKSSGTYIAQGLPKYINMYHDIAGDKGIFVLQGQLTDGLFVFGPQFRERTHNQNMNEYVKGLIKSSDLAYINIIMRDFVNVTKNSYILELNLFKNTVTVKPNSINVFVAALDEFVDVTYVAPAP